MIKKILFVFMIILFAQMRVSAQLSVDEIVNKANLASYYAGADGKSNVRMVITDSQKRERIREFTILRKTIKAGGDQNFYVYFEKPADVRKMVFLVKKYIEKDDDRWLYMSNLDLVKRIAASDKRSSFVGSDFLYEDVSGRNINEDKHTLEKTENGFYMLKSVPKKSGTVEFSHYFVWINQKTFVPEKIEFYKNDKLYRRVSALKIEEIQGITTVTESKVENFETGGFTVNTMSNIKYNIGIPDEIFTERFLRRPPTEWLRK